MSYFIIGSNYELSDTSFSSKTAFDNVKLEKLHTQLINYNLADCCLIISTCNRSEVLVYKRQVENLEYWISRIRELVFKVHNLDINSYKNNFYEKTNYQACLHLLKVACGLDSLVLGEPQITGQIKDAMNYTEQFYHDHNLKIPSEFFKLLDETFACAKEVRTKTAIGKYAVSIAYMACKIARDVLKDFSNEHILLIGASQTNLLLAKHLIRNNINNIKVINRSKENGQKFIEELGVGTLYGFESLNALLSESTLVFSSTSANDFIVNYELLEQIQTKRNHKEILLFDLAIPNDIDPKVRHISGVNLYNRDDLQTLVNINKQKRYDATKDCMPILYKYLNEYQQQNRILQGNEIIVKYRDSVHQQRQKLVEDAKMLLNKGVDPVQVIESLSTALTNKILHTPTLMLASFIKNGQSCELNSIHEFLDRKEKDTFQNIVDNTLNKDIFKNNCCKGDAYDNCCRKQNSYVSNFISPESTGNYKDLDQEYTITANDFIKNEFSEYQYSDESIKDGDISKCPFHQEILSNTNKNDSNLDNTNNLDKDNIDLENNKDYNLKENKVILSSLNDVRGIFIPSNMDDSETKVLNELVLLVDQSLNNNTNANSYLVDNANEPDTGIVKVKFKN